jgi:dihydroorotate dehydrogenase (NAD+) catalytic subunit
MAQVTIGGLVFRNPVLTASGTFGMGDVFADFIDYSKLGGIILKTVTRKPRRGNPPPRILETPSGLLNSIGLENDGFDAVLAELKEHDRIAKYPTRVIFSIAGDTVGDYAEMCRAFDSISGIAAFELNLSCPNIHSGGATFDSDCKNVVSITGNVRKATKKPVFVKLSPANDLVGNARAAEGEGADAVTVSNTYLGMAIDLKRKDFVFKNKVAGFSGPAVKPISLYNVYRVCSAVKLPVIASGGISNLSDAKEFLFVGASMITVGTMNFVEPSISQEIAEGLEAEG